MDHLGRIALEACLDGRWDGLTTSNAVELLKWTFVTATYRKRRVLRSTERTSPSVRRVCERSSLGRGLRVFADGREIAASATLGRITGTLPEIPREPVLARVRTVIEADTKELKMRTSRVIHCGELPRRREVGDVIVGGVAPPPGATLWSSVASSSGTTTCGALCSTSRAGRFPAR